MPIHRPGSRLRRRVVGRGDDPRHDVRAGLEAAIANCETTADGVCFPSELYTNAAKYHAAANARS